MIFFVQEIGQGCPLHIFTSKGKMSISLKWQYNMRHILVEVLPNFVKVVNISFGAEQVECRKRYSHKMLSF